MTTNEKNVPRPPSDEEEKEMDRRQLRESLGKKVREVWVAWAKEQPNPKPSWLAPWEGLSEPEKEVDRRIGWALFMRGLEADEFRHLSKGISIDELRAEARRYRSEADQLRDELRIQMRQTKEWRDRANKPSRTPWVLGWSLLLLTSISLMVCIQTMNLIPEPVTCPEPVVCEPPLGEAEAIAPTAPTEARGYIVGDDVGIPMVVPWPDTTNYPPNIFIDDCEAVCSSPGPGMDGVPGRVLQVDPAHLICTCFHTGEAWPVTRWINWERNP